MRRFRYRFEAVLGHARALVDAARRDGVVARRDGVVARRDEVRAEEALALARAAGMLACPSSPEPATCEDRDAWIRACRTRTTARSIDVECARERVALTRGRFDAELRRLGVFERDRTRRQREHDDSEERREDAGSAEAHAAARLRARVLP